MTLSTLFIDLDDTVYPASAGVWKAIRQRIDAYIQCKLNMPYEEAVRLRQELFQRYGTTMRGLQEVYALDEEDYLRYVHDIPIADLIKPNPDLRQLLEGLPYRKVILTNADTRHALRVLNTIGITECFEHIIDIRALSPYCKPMLKAFEVALQYVDVTAAECAVVEDSEANLITAKLMGFYTVRVGGETDCIESDACIDSIMELDRIFG